MQVTVRQKQSLRFYCVHFYRSLQDRERQEFFFLLLDTFLINAWEIFYININTQFCSLAVFLENGEGQRWCVKGNMPVNRPHFSL